MCECKIGPGKFEGESALTFMAWEQTMLGADATTDSEGSLIEWLRSPLNLDADDSVVKAALAYGYCRTCVDEAGQDIGGGVAVWEDSQGFVYSATFDTHEAFDSALTEAEQDDANATE